MIIAASQWNECQFCTRSHCDLVTIAGILEAPLELVAHPSALEPRERLAIEFTRAAMKDGNHIPEALWLQVGDVFTEPEVVELTFLVGYINMLNLFNNCLGVRYSGEYSVLAAAPANAHVADAG